MAVGEYRVNGRRVAVRAFPVPKRATLKAWYINAQKAMPAMPKFEPRFIAQADITWDTIILDWVDAGPMLKHQVFIARKRQLL